MYVDYYFYVWFACWWKVTIPLLMHEMLKIREGDYLRISINEVIKKKQQSRGKTGGRRQQVGRPYGVLSRYATLVDGLTYSPNFSCSRKSFPTMLGMCLIASSCFGSSFVGLPVSTSASMKPKACGDLSMKVMKGKYLSCMNFLIRRGMRVTICSLRG